MRGSGSGMRDGVFFLRGETSSFPGRVRYIARHVRFAKDTSSQERGPSIMGASRGRGAHARRRSGRPNVCRSGFVLRRAYRPGRTSINGCLNRVVGDSLPASVLNLLNDDRFDRMCSIAHGIVDHAARDGSPRRDSNVAGGIKRQRQGYCRYGYRSNGSFHDSGGMLFHFGRFRGQAPWELRYPKGRGREDPRDGLYVQRFRVKGRGSEGRQGNRGQRSRDGMGDERPACETCQLFVRRLIFCGGSVNWRFRWTGVKSVGGVARSCSGGLLSLFGGAARPKGLLASVALFLLGFVGAVRTGGRQELSSPVPLTPLSAVWAPLLLRVWVCLDGPNVVVQDRAICSRFLCVQSE